MALALPVEDDDSIAITLVVKNHYDPCYSFHTVVKDAESYRILDLKQQINREHKGNPSVSDQRIIHRGTLLNDNTSIHQILTTSASLSNLCQLVLHLTLKGGSTTALGIGLNPNQTDNTESPSESTDAAVSEAVPQNDTSSTNVPLLPQPQPQPQQSFPASMYAMPSPYPIPSAYAPSNPTPEAFQPPAMLQYSSVSSTPNMSQSQPSHQSMYPNYGYSDPYSGMNSYQYQQWYYQYYIDYYRTLQQQHPTSNQRPLNGAPQQHLNSTNILFKSSLSPSLLTSAPASNTTSNAAPNGAINGVVPTSNNELNTAPHVMPQGAPVAVPPPPVTDPVAPAPAPAAAPDAVGVGPDAAAGVAVDNNGGGAPVQPIFRQQAEIAAMLNAQQREFRWVNLFNINMLFRLFLFVFFFGQHLGMWQWTVLCLCGGLYYLYSVGLVKYLFGDVVRRFLTRGDANNNDNRNNNNNGNNEVRNVDNNADMNANANANVNANENENTDVDNAAVNNEPQIIVVNRLTLLQIMKRFMVGFVVSLWPEWSYHEWYPPPPRAPDAPPAAIHN